MDIVANLSIDGTLRYVDSQDKVVYAAPMTYGCYLDRVHDDGVDRATVVPEAVGYVIELFAPTATCMGTYVWLPTCVFETLYRLAPPEPMLNMTFEQALAAIKRGYRVTRSEWGHVGVVVFQVAGSHPSLNGLRDESAYGALTRDFPADMGTVLTIHPHLDMRRGDGSVLVGWVPTQMDLFATDWRVVM